MGQLTKFFIALTAGGLGLTGLLLASCGGAILLFGTTQASSAVAMLSGGVLALWVAQILFVRARRREAVLRVRSLESFMATFSIALGLFGIGVTGFSFFVRGIAGPSANGDALLVALIGMLCIAAAAAVWLYAWRQPRD